MLTVSNVLRMFIVLPLGLALLCVLLIGFSFKVIVLKMCWYYVV